MALSVAASAGKRMHIAFVGRGTVKQIMLGRAGIGLELADMLLPVKRDTRRHRKSAFGIFDRLRQRAVEAKAAVRFQDCFPGIDSTRARSRHELSCRSRAFLCRATPGRTPLRRHDPNRCIPTPVCRAARSGSNNRRRSRSCAARPRTTPRPRPPLHPPLCRLHAAYRLQQASRAGVRSLPCLRRRSRASGRAAENRGS